MVMYLTDISLRCCSNVVAMVHSFVISYCTFITCQTAVMCEDNPLIKFLAVVEYLLIVKFT
jgi:hypothetical protein